MTIVATVGTFSVNTVLSRTFAVLGRNFVPFLLLALLLVGLPTSLASFSQLLLTSPEVQASTGPDLSAAAVLLFGSWLVGAVTNAVLQGAVIHGTVSDLAGHRVSFGEALGTGLRHLLPLVVIGLFSAICTFIGFVLFIVPGVLLSLAWSVTAPVLVMERTTIPGAYGRSLELTRNHRGAIFGLAIIAAVAGLVIQVVATGVAGGLGATAVMSQRTVPGVTGLMVVQAITGLIAQTANALIGSVGAASVYFELRQAKEGVGAEQLAAVFD